MNHNKNQQRRLLSCLVACILTLVPAITMAESLTYMHSSLDRTDIAWMEEEIDRRFEQFYASIEGMTEEEMKDAYYLFRSDLMDTFGYYVSWPNDVEYRLSQMFFSKQLEFMLNPLLRAAVIPRGSQISEVQALIIAEKAIIENRPDLDKEELEAIYLSAKLLNVDPSNSNSYYIPKWIREKVRDDCIWHVDCMVVDSDSPDTFAPYSYFVYLRFEVRIDPETGEVVEFFDYDHDGLG